MAKVLVEENTRIAQAKQKAYYDQKTKELNLQPGDQVLLLLPSSKKTFVAQCQGPYEVTRRMGKVNYEIWMPNKGGCEQVFHINHLSKWQGRTCKVIAVIEDGDAIEEYHWSNKHQPQFGQQLAQDQRNKIVQLLSQFSQMTSDNPGKTNKTTPKIRTIGNPSVRQKP